MMGDTFLVISRVGQIAEIGGGSAIDVAQGVEWFACSCDAHSENQVTVWTATQYRGADKYSCGLLVLSIVFADCAVGTSHNRGVCFFPGATYSLSGDGGQCTSCCSGASLHTQKQFVVHLKQEPTLTHLHPYSYQTD